MNEHGRLKNKVALIVGAGCVSPKQIGIGNPPIIALPRPSECDFVQSWAKFAESMKLLLQWPNTPIPQCRQKSFAPSAGLAA